MSMSPFARKAFPVVVVIAFILLVGAFTWLTDGSTDVRGFRQASSSMMSAILPGDVFVTNLSHRSVTRGGVVVIVCHGMRDRWCVTRVIGLPGDTVSVRGHHAYVNGARLDEPYADTTVYSSTDSVVNRKAVIVPPDNVWVLGDHRGESYDSRFWGFVPRSDVRGRPVRIYWSKDPYGGVRWSRIGRRIR